MDMRDGLPGPGNHLRNEMPVTICAGRCIERVQRA